MSIRRIRNILLASMIVVLCLGQTVFAESYSFKGSVEYKGGDTIETDYDADRIAKALDQLEPEDSIKITISYRNKSKKKTDWYLINSVLETLEESREQADNGGYTYILKNIGPGGNETTIFSNSRVGGDKKKGVPEGLKQATDATGRYFYIQTLAPGKSGKTSLYVEFDGETGNNDYMDTTGSLMLSYAVTEAGDEEGSESHPTKTGDGNLWPIILINLTALLLLILAAVRIIRDRKGGEVNE